MNGCWTRSGGATSPSEVLEEDKHERSEHKLTLRVPQLEELRDSDLAPGVRLGLRLGFSKT